MGGMNSEYRQNRHKQSKKNKPKTALKQKSSTLGFADWTEVKLMDYCSAAVEGRKQNSTNLLFVNVTWEQIILRVGKNIPWSPWQYIAKRICHSTFMKRPAKEYKSVGDSISLKLLQIDCLSYCVAQKSVKFPLSQIYHLPD